MSWSPSIQIVIMDDSLYLCILSNIRTVFRKCVDCLELYFRVTSLYKLNRYLKIKPLADMPLSGQVRKYRLFVESQKVQHESNCSDNRYGWSDLNESFV